MKQETSLVGYLIVDSGKIGMIVNEIKSGTWSEDPWFNWTTSYEIKYADGDTCIMTSNSLHRLIESGKITILEGNKK